MNLYVGNLSRSVTEAALKDKFKEVASANVSSCKLIRDRLSGELRGFGFIEIADDQEAQRAIDTMNGYELDGRKLVVNEAREQDRSARPPRFNREPRGGNGNGNFGGFRPKRF